VLVLVLDFFGGGKRPHRDQRSKIEDEDDDDEDELEGDLEGERLRPVNRFHFDDSFVSKARSASESCSSSSSIFGR
jgi:hypothetical protein